MCIRDRVYAMRVSEALTWDQYSTDPRFQSKQPFRRGSRKQTCGDNIYFRKDAGAPWQQRDSFHSREDGGADPQHVNRDTGVNRVLVSQDFVYMGGQGPFLPDLRDAQGRPVSYTHLDVYKRQVFLSYKRDESAAAAVQLFAELSARQYEVFLDTHSIAAGVDFQESLWHSLCDVDVLLMLDSPNYFASRWTAAEYGRALAKGIGVLRVEWPCLLYTSRCV